MDLLPAIDLMDGKCVRLIQGDYHRQITYEDDPVRQARIFADAGASWLHIVDLDGAKVGKPMNIEAIKAISQAALGLKIEVGGGIRDEDAITQMLDAGVERVIIGTMAANEFDWFAEMANKFTGRIVLGLDARGSKVSTSGWLKDTHLKLRDFAIKAAVLPLAAIIYTDISKDGMMAGPNLERTRTLAESVDVDIVAAGGVTAVEDVRKLKDMGIAGAIIGRAIYEGKIDLSQAIEAAK
ncbi:MAG TPA: 1-(5-phosphoribosyl)-5-[(5-phosphoribosylamino)methylideneamino]imidazole-4-carboxamide isomerase [Phycisphaerales bacterium]|nr:1-(5-phosphoribosyl)-5-[(5-phosphoribosylamino)methylideneamino]imidazole-4-carboxamide isomerase [Phycisphaerales bacterium]